MISQCQFIFIINIISYCTSMNCCCPSVHLYSSINYKTCFLDKQRCQSASQSLVQWEFFYFFSPSELWSRLVDAIRHVALSVTLWEHYHEDKYKIRAAVSSHCVRQTPWWGIEALWENQQVRNKGQIYKQCVKEEEMPTLQHDWMKKSHD